jgi:hypothetical protein
MISRKTQDVPCLLHARLEVSADAAGCYVDVKSLTRECC